MRWCTGLDWTGSPGGSRPVEAADQKRNAEEVRRLKTAESEIANKRAAKLRARAEELTREADAVTRGNAP